MELKSVRQKHKKNLQNKKNEITLDKQQLMYYIVLYSIYKEEIWQKL